MDISSVGALAGTDSASSAQSLADNFDTFLSLLTAQLQNQDPLEPLDTNEFTNQLVQFTEVEQAITTNQNLELLVEMSRAASAGSAVSYLGQDIVADGSEAALQNGEATWTYDLAAKADTVSLTIVDENGFPVFTTEGETGAGLQSFTWDGKTQGGQSQPDGLYTLQVNARDAAGNALIAETSVRGKVTAVDFTQSDPTLTVNGVTVPVASVRQVGLGT